MTVKRLGDLMLILFPLISLVVVLHLMAAATDDLNDTWQEQTP